MKSILLHVIFFASHAFAFRPPLPSYLKKTRSFPVMSTMEGSATDSSPIEEEGIFSELSRVEIRTGKILEVSSHPTLEKIFVEKIDLNEEEGPRTICSGLVGYVSEADLIGADVVVLCNLKPRDLEGVPSNGMVLCASNDDHTMVKLVVPPSGTPAGTLVTFSGHLNKPDPAGNRAVKAWKKIGKSFFTDSDGVACFTGEPSAPFMTPLGPCTSAISSGPIS
mmetsp:Transcript_16988/g.33665  ORF Transcript_16988/g.33665 Transcript_16988/m.33665 type:complete len:222 (+) Transcript_16988:87-752(+)